MNFEAKAKLFALDDWGLSRGINDGILELAETGYVASVSLMGNQPFLEHSLGYLESLGTQLTFHLNLTEGKPLSQPGAVDSLVDRDGQFFPLRRFLVRLYAGKLRSEELAREAERQLLRIRSVVRSNVGALEAHHHIHLLPGVFSAVWPRLSRLGISRYRKIRRGSQAGPLLASRLFSLYETWRKPAVNPMFVGAPAIRQLSDVRALQRFAARAGHPILLHPAARDDLAETGSVDPLVRRRSQLELAKDYIRRLENR